MRESQLFHLGSNPDELLAEHAAPDLVTLLGQTPGPEQHNLAQDPRYAAKLREMEALLLAEMQRLDDPYSLWYQASAKE